LAGYQARATEEVIPARGGPVAKPPVDAQTVTDAGLEIFEAVATLEFTGRRPSRSAIAAAAQRDQAPVDAALEDMAEYGLLTKSAEDGEPVYVPARRDWSTAPGQAAGHPME
jgi:hypothetical protein